MATESNHRKQADHNQACIDALDAAQFPDWAVTMHFYKAVHLTEVLFLNRKVVGKRNDHQLRNQLIKTNYPSLWYDYSDLLKLSALARYHCFQISTKQLGEAKILLTRIESAIVAMRK